MSPLWRNRYSVALHPQRAVVVRRRRGLRTVAEPVHAETWAGAPSQPNWREAAQAFERLAQHIKQQGGDSVSVVLSNHFVRYLLIPWSDRIASAEEFGNYAAASFADVYGVVAEDWELCVSRERAGAPRVAAAVDRALLEALRAAAAAARLRIKSIKPHLMAAFNRFAQRRRAERFVFATAEDERVCVLVAQAGAWRHVGCMAIAQPQDVAIPALIDRELRLVGVVDDPPSFIHADDSERALAALAM